MNLAQSAGLAVDDWLTTLRRLFASAIVFVAIAPGVHAQSSAAQTSDKADALSQAARKGDAAAVKKLLDEGVDVNTRFRYDRTALSFAADRGHVDVVRLLIDRGADAYYYLASEDGDMYVIKAGPTYELRATNPIGQVIMATPAISNGTLIIRGLKDVIAIGNRQ